MLVLFDPDLNGDDRFETAYCNLHESQVHLMNGHRISCSMFILISRGKYRSIESLPSVPEKQHVETNSAKRALQGPGGVHVHPCWTARAKRQDIRELRLRAAHPLRLSWTGELVIDFTTPRGSFSVQVQDPLLVWANMKITLTLGGAKTKNFEISGIKKWYWIITYLHNSIHFAISKFWSSQGLRPQKCKTINHLRFNNHKLRARNKLIHGH